MERVRGITSEQFQAWNRAGITYDNDGGLNFGIVLLALPTLLPIVIEAEYGVKISLIALMLLQGLGVLSGVVVYALGASWARHCNTLSRQLGDLRRREILRDLNLPEVSPDKCQVVKKNGLALLILPSE